MFYSILTYIWVSCSGLITSEGERELFFLLLFTCNYVVSVRRGFLFLWVLEIGSDNLLWHTLGLPFNYFGLQFQYSNKCFWIIEVIVSSSVTSWLPFNITSVTLWRFAFFFYIFVLTSYWIERYRTIKNGRRFLFSLSIYNTPYHISDAWIVCCVNNTQMIQKLL